MRIILAFRLALLSWCLLQPVAALAQGNQCRTAPVGASSPNCASETFVTDSIAAAPQGTVTSVGTGGLATGGPITGTGTVTVTAASKAQQQTGSSATIAVTPLHQQDHDSAIKVSVSIVGSSGVVNSSYNVSGVVRNAAGTYTVSFTTAFANTLYGCNVTSTSSGTNTFGLTSSKAVGSVVVSTVTLAGTPTDPLEADLICWGRQ